MRRQALVEEGVIAFEEVENAGVVAHNRTEKELALALHGGAQGHIKIGEFLHVGAMEFQVAQVQPLPGKILLQRQCAVVRQHACDLLLQHFWLA